MSQLQVNQVKDNAKQKQKRNKTIKPPNSHKELAELFQPIPSN
jgi:hypothetical protein